MITLQNFGFLCIAISIIGVFGGLILFNLNYINNVNAAIIMFVVGALPIVVLGIFERYVARGNVND